MAAFLAEIARVVDPALDECFPPGSGVTLRAGPGRCYMASAFMLAVGIVAKKKKKKIVLKEQTGSDNGESSEKACMCYVNDGVRGPFNCILSSMILRT